MNYSSKIDLFKVFSLLCVAFFIFVMPLSADNASDSEKKQEDKSLNLLALNTKSAIQAEALVKVRGFVVDEFGEPMVGVEVLAEGSDFKAITNTEGKYVVMAKEDDTLKFSQFGVQTKKEKITTSNILNISLSIE